MIERVLGGKVSVSTPHEMAAHRLRGHVPFEPSCQTCQSGKGAHKHARKRTNKGLSVVIQADFALFNRDSEVVTDLEDDGSLLNCLVLIETCCFDVIGQTERSIEFAEMVGGSRTEDE